MDGPNYLQLFQDMKCLNGESNQQEIVNHLLFFKEQGNYEAYLKHYFPMLTPENQPEFVKDFVSLSPAPEELVAEIEKKIPVKDITFAEEVKEEIIEAPKKKRKSSPKK